MNCTLARKLMHLYRPGELSSAQQRALHDHVRSCSQCSKEAERVGRYDRLITPLRDLKPFLNNPEELTSSILWEIEKPRARTELVGLWLRMPSSVASWGRAAFYCVVCGMLLLCAGQTYTDARRLERLEDRLHTASLRGGPELHEMPSVRGSLHVVTQLRHQLQECGQTPFPDVCFSAFSRAVVPLLLRAQESPPSAAMRSVKPLSLKYGHLLSLFSQGRMQHDHPTDIVAEGNRLLNDVEQLLLEGGSLQ